MSHINKIIIIFLTLVSLGSLSAQTWPHIYGETDRHEFSEDVGGAYDNGYKIAGNFLSENLAPKSTWLIKTDINGNILWEKILSNSGYNKTKAITQSSNGGTILCGLIRYQGDDISNPYVAKLDACGEKLWCRVFSENIGNAYSSWASDVKETPSGDIIVLVNEYGNHPINTMHLFKLNAGGEVLWRNPYASAYNHPGSINPRGNKLLITTEGDYLIVGQIYWEDPWNPGGTAFGIRPMFTLIDSMGTEKWILPFGLNDTIYGEAYNVIEKNKKEFIAVATKWPDEPQIIPMFIKFDGEGNVLNYQTINAEEIDSTFSEGHFGHIIQQDTNYFLSGTFEIGSTEKAPLTNIYMDTNIFTNNPNISSKATYLNQYWPYSSNKTSKVKFLNTSKYVASGETDISFSKVNPFLEMDTLDPGNHTYDSLCTTPGLPQSSFISLDDCDLFVDIDEIPNAKQYQEKIRWIPIKAYPNPAQNGKLTLEFENTEHHQNMELRCYDNFGRQIHSQKVYKDQQDTDLDVSGWSPGIYVAVVYSNGGARGKVKFVVE